MSLEHTIFGNIINNHEYGGKVLPFLREEYFHNFADKVVFKTIFDHYENYKCFPSKEALKVDLQNRTELDDEQFEECNTIVKEIPKQKDELTSVEWLTDQTEKWCQDKAIHNAIHESIQILDGSDSRRDKGSIPKLLQDALAVSFKTDLGHDYLEDIESRFAFYHNQEERIPFDIDTFNKITKGGLIRKEMSVILAMTGGGKSLMMTSMAAAHLVAGRNVLYISMEMAKERIAQRIDMNLMDCSTEDLETMPWDVFQKKAQRIKDKTIGKLVIEEYPTGSASAANFRYLLNELKQKKGFVPDVVFVDYLNICASSRYRNNNTANSYTIIKSVAEELRGLAVEFNVALITATQTNRDGIDASDLSLTNISESMGVAHTAGLIFAIVNTPELDEMNQIMIVQLKNRYNDLNYYKRFMVGIQRGRMRIYNVENSANDGLQDAGYSDKSNFSNDGSFDKSKFSGFDFD